jgi:hypothetical protein
MEHEGASSLLGHKKKLWPTVYAAHIHAKLRKPSTRAGKIMHGSARNALLQEENNACSVSPWLTSRLECTLPRLWLAR